MDCTCAYCHTTFPVVPSRVGRTKYCSRDCKNVARQNQRHQTCPSCGKMFSSKVSRHQRYCSHACAYRDRMVPLRALSINEQALITQYESLVASVARKMHIEFNPQHMEYADFYQEGMVGLITAIVTDKDPTRKAEFPGFAKVHIRAAIIAAYRTQERGIRLPESLYRHDANVTPEQLKFHERIASCVSTEDLATEREYMEPSRNIASYGEYVRSRGVASLYVNPVEKATLQTERVNQLYQSLRTLPEQQRQLIAEHYGLAGEETAMLQLCQRYNIPRATMHRLVHRGLDSMKKILEVIA